MESLVKLAVALGKNHILESSIANLKNLKSLAINGHVNKLPKVVTQLQNLEELELFDTKISTLPKEIDQLESLWKRLTYPAVRVYVKFHQLSLVSKSSKTRCG